MGETGEIDIHSIHVECKSWTRTPKYSRGMPKESFSERESVKTIAFDDHEPRQIHWGENPGLIGKGVSVNMKTSGLHIGII